MHVGDDLMTALVGLDESVGSERLPELGGEDLTEECPRPQSLNKPTPTIDARLLLYIASSLKRNHNTFPFPFVHLTKHTNKG